MVYQVAALYVDPSGPYPRIAEMWYDIRKDARTYAGPLPVVAHPPCERWGRYWSGGPMLAKTPKRRVLGDDGGCFSSALAAVRRWGGVLEHPEASHAWRVNGLNRPRWRKGWISAGDGMGVTCCVAQGNYGHKSRKLTWLYYVGSTEPQELDWSIPVMQVRLDDGFHSATERRKAIKCGMRARLSHKDRAATPLAFAHVLCKMAEGAK